MPLSDHKGIKGSLLRRQPKGPEFLFCGVKQTTFTSVEELQCDVVCSMQCKQPGSYFARDVNCMLAQGSEDTNHSRDCFWVNCACCSHDLIGLGLACTQAPSLQQHSDM